MAEEFQMGVTTKGLISLLQATLTDRYKDYFCIIQELLQNADDAESKTVVFGIEPDGLNVSHALAKLPGMYVINDGPVTRENMAAIFSVAAGDKGNEKNKIGKFGLGMKSVFHACEGFFMFGQGHEGDLFPQFCTPWLGPYHKDWRSDWAMSKAEMVGRVNNLVSRVLPNAKRWFCVWLPLRSVKADDGIYPIIGEYPGDDDLARLLNPEFTARAMRFLPMLKHVKLVRFVGADGNVVSARLSTKARLMGHDGSELSGELTSEGGGGIAYEYVGYEHVDHNPTFERLRESPRWPKRTDFDERKGMVPYKDKTSSHVAVCLLREPSKTPTVAVSPCVFLPLSGVRDDPDRFVTRSEGSDSYNLYLHGNFFVDAGRQDFEIGDVRLDGVQDPKDETSLRKVWNRTLFKRAVLPLIVPELEKAAARWQDSSFDSFMLALPNVEYVREWEREICATHRLLYVCDANGWRWRSVPRRDAVYSLPVPKDAAFLARLVTALPEDVHFADLGRGGLSGGRDFSSKDREFIDAVFAAAAQTNVDRLLTDEMRPFWEGFFSRFEDPHGAFAFWQRIIRDSKIRKYSDFISENRQLILRSRSCFTVLPDCRVAAKDIATWQALVSAARTRIPLADPDSALVGLPVGSIATDDGERILAAVRNLSDSDRIAGTAYELVLGIVKAVGMRNLSAECREFPYWVIDGKTFSYNDLQQLSEQCRLYRGKVDSEEKRIFLAAVDWELLRVSPEEKREGLVEALGLDAPVLGPDLFVSILKKVPELKGVQARADLVRLLLKSSCKDGHGWQIALRYLAHAKKSFADKTAPLYFPAEGLPKEFARASFAAIAKATTGEQYEIPREISELLSVPVREQLFIHEVDNEGLVRLLADTPGLKFDCFGDDDWKQLLRLADSLYHKETTRALVRKIPLFKADDGSRVALGTNSFRQGRLAVPSVFRKVVKVIAESGDEELDKRLALVVPKWGYEDAIRFSKDISLSAEQFAEIAKPILRLLPKITPENVDYLASVAWIETSRGYVVPSRLVNLPGLRHLCESDDLVYRDELSDDDVWEDLLRHGLLPSKSDSLARVFRVLSEEPLNCIGVLKHLDVLSPEEFVSTFDNVSVMPVSEILKECIKNDLGIWCGEALRALRKPVPLDRYVAIVNFLTERGTDAEKWLFPYLDEIADPLSVSQSAIANLKVRSANGKVKAAGMVCTYADGIADEHILHRAYREKAPRFYKLLADNTSTARPAPQSAAGTLESYFKDWDPNFNERICGFVYCCTDEQDLLNRAKERWGLDGRGDPQSWRGKICGELHRLIRGQKLRLWIYDTSEVCVVALDGSLLRLGLRNLSEGDTLFYGEGDSCRYDPIPMLRNMSIGGRQPTLELKLRRIKGDELKMSAPVLDGVLRKTLETIVYRLCSQWMVDLGEFWSELSNVEQVDIAVTRAKLLEKADVYLPMIRCEDPELKKHFKAWSEIGYAIQDARKRKGSSARYQQLLCEKDRRIEDFAALVESSPSVQDNILSAIREQMETYAYHVESLLFELFQNADDAAEELRSLYPDGHVDFHDEFVVEYDGRNLVVAHWGRQINQNKGIGSDLHSHASFAYDLEKMLMLMQSGKSGEGLKVTGKFGLGFKTVFFFTDTPIVMSGRLKFRIVGGFLPKALADEERIELNPIWSRFARDKEVHKPTVFILPVREDCKRLVEDALEAFSKSAELSASFARRIKKIRISFANGKKHELDCSGDDIGRGYRFFRIGHGNNDTGAIVVAQQDGFPQSVDPDVPTYWVTVPTRQKLAMGFVINGRFELDTGRSNLNRASRKNDDAVAALSEGLFGALCRDWEARRGKDSLEGYYEGLWRVFSSCENAKVWLHDSAYLAYGILWGEETGGARRFFSKNPVVPAGLSGAYRVLTRVSSVKHVLTKELEESPLADVLGLCGLVPGSIVSGKLYPKGTREFLSGFDAKEFGFTDFFDAACELLGKLSPDIANGEPGKKICEYLCGEGKHPDVQAYVEKVRFLAKDGETWAIAKDLVVSDGDEALKAAFCPDTAILSDEYDAEGIRLFKKIRGNRSFSSEQLARFAASADSEDLRISVLKYLLVRDDMAMAGFLAGELRPSWLENVSGLDWFKRLQEKDRMRIASLLDLGVGAVCSWQPPDGDSGDSGDYPQIEERQLTVDTLRDWWSIHGEESLRHYNNTVYGRPRVRDLEFDVNNPEMRSEWLELFVLASARTLGYRDCQHKGFVEMLKGRGYWNVYSREDSTADEWMDTLEKFIQLPAFAQEYQYWMRLFIRIYQFARHLNGYVQYVQMWERVSGTAIYNLMDIKSNAALTGTGIDIPDMSRAINAHGWEFLVRELLRRKALKNPALEVYCGMSPQFKGETFGGAYDLALTYYLRDNSEQGVRYVF